MNTTNIFFINMKKNWGKRQLIKNMVNKLSGIIIDGVDKSIYNNDILIKKSSQEISTRAAKEAKINLLKNFINTNTSQYLVLFEDDILLHKNFYEYFNKTIIFANTNKFKLIYFGVSCNSLQLNNSNFQINLLPKVNYRFSGAYGIIIHRSIIQTLINRSNDPFFYNKPFDIYSLGHIQLSYPNECFICNPQIVIPIISSSDIRNPRDQNILWNKCHINKNYYIHNNTIPMYIYVNNNKYKLFRFIDLLNMLVPIIDPIFIYETSNIIQKYFDNTYKNMNIMTFYDSFIQNQPNIYILTNICINWNILIGDLMNFNKNIIYLFSECPICCKQNNNLILYKNIFSGFSIINKNYKNIDYINTKIIFDTTNCTCNFS